jgi:hypothetical protein
MQRRGAWLVRPFQPFGRPELDRKRQSWTKKSTSDMQTVLVNPRLFMFKFDVQY